MALWGIPNTQSSIWGTDLQLGSRNWTRAHTELGEFHDRKKWTPMDHPLAREDRLPNMQNHPRRAAYIADQQLENESTGWAGGPNANLESIGAAKLIANQIDAAKGHHKQRVAKAHQTFVENFDAWLRGNGRPDEYERAGMHDLAIKARQLQANGYRGRDGLLTLTPISKDQSVYKYLDKKFNRKVDYELDIAKMRLRQGRTGPPGRELTIREAWNLYKYGVHGMDPQGYRVNPDTGHPDGSNGPEEPLIEEIENDYNQTDAIRATRSGWVEGRNSGPPYLPPGPDPYQPQLPEVPVVINPAYQRIIDAQPNQAMQGEAPAVEPIAPVAGVADGDIDESREDDSEEDLDETAFAEPSQVDQTLQPPPPTPAPAPPPAPKAAPAPPPPPEATHDEYVEYSKLNSALTQAQYTEYIKRSIARFGGHIPSVREATALMKEMLAGAPPPVAIKKEPVASPAASATISLDKATVPQPAPGPQAVGGAPVTGATPAADLAAKRAAAATKRAAPKQPQRTPIPPTAIIPPNRPTPGKLRASSRPMPTSPSQPAAPPSSPAAPAQPKTPVNANLEQEIEDDIILEANAAAIKNVENAYKEFRATTPGTPERKQATVKWAKANKDAKDFSQEAAQVVRRRSSRLQQKH